ncbi:hypothetical protein M405DRAFT_853064 [Rhizopogon salebrosus TDB-379]|nr:hypothetical protein M405DRAFT_853064 [Rhizopogon salebrosus TDB-379]
MSDGTRLRQTWKDALDGAEAIFRQLLTSHSSSEWKHISLASDSSSPGKGKSRASTNPDLADVVVHRKATKSGEYVYRVVLDVPITDQSASVDAWKAVITTPELRQEWDPAVESAHLVEMFDRQTRISKTNFTLGWPANPRDAVQISRLYQDASTIIDISTSLPRSSDEPAYLRPSPPYVRSNVALFAWCIQYVQPSPAPQPNSPAGQIKRRMSTFIAQPRLRITCFWQHDLRALWNFGSSSGVCQQLCTMMLGLYKTVLVRGTRIPVLAGHGYGLSIEKIRFQLDRQALAIEYVIHSEEEDHPVDQALYTIKEHKRLVRSLECVLPSSEGWDVQLTMKGSSQKVESLPWNATASRQKSSSISGSKPPELTILRISHAPLPDDHSILKVRAIIELSGPSSGIRLNGLPQTIQLLEERDPSSFVQQQQQILQDATSAADVSFQTASSVNSVASSSTTPTRPQLARSLTERSAAAEKTILSRVKRSYIYFSSLLQEPEAKWKRTTEARGVSVTQLDSIDPTLVVYRAEATFVGLGLWDLYGALVSPGARVFWDKQHEDAVLLEDVNELTELWHFKTKPAWPVQGRDNVLLKTVYKSPTTIHVFSFSVDDPYLFPSIPPQDPTVIRTQVDLQGWAIEALSPSTTQLTLLEQSDPKGWSNKASIPQSMISALAGVGDFVIKCGGPPVVTRLAGAKANEMRYDHEKGTFRVEYEGSESRRGPTSPDSSTNESASPTNPRTIHTIECEIRCDMDTWTSALDVVVDPPPHTVSALRRHRLSAGGGGLWLTLTHDALFAADERLLAIVRRGPMGSGKDKGTVMVNGARITVDVEELPEQEIKALAKRKRVKPLRIPLDQPPVMGIIRRRRAEWDADGESTPTPESTVIGSASPEPLESPTPSSTWLSTPKFSSPLASFWSTALESATTTTQQAVAAMAPGDGGAPSASRSPMQHAAEALQWMRDLQCGGVDAKAGWTLVSSGGISVHRKLLTDISPVIPVHKGEKVIEGVSAEEVAAVVMNNDCRKQWDVRFASASILERFGAKCHTSFLVTKGGFPFRDRGFFLASILARSRLPVSSLDITPGETGPSQDRSVIFCVSASFSPESAASFSPSKYNSYALPIGRAYIDGWMFETLDPYTKENYAIPSTRCTRVVAVDYAGSIPVAVNSLINGALPKSILAVETYIKSNSPMPYTRLPAAGVVLAEQKGGTGVNAPSWRLRKKDDNRMLIASTFSPLNRTHCSVLLLTMANATPSRPNEPIPRLSGVGLPLSTTPDARANASGEVPASSSTPSLSSPNRRRASSASARSASGEPSKPSSSAFTLKGEIRHSTDLLVAEIVVDSKLYPEGYEVLITSRPREITKFISLETLGSSRKDAVDSEGSSSTSTSVDLPISSSVYTIPASPLHSSGLNADRPPRHLVRLTLPTAQYQVSTVKDPLTGETRSAPPKPQWFNDLHEKGFVVRVEIKPVVTPAPGVKSGVVVKVGGASVGIASEKESLTALGRDELQDDRVSRMSVLQRSADDGDSFPDELKVPLSRADDLIDNDAIIPAIDINEDPKASEENVPKAEETENGSPVDAPENGAITLTVPSAPSGGGLFGFLNAYPNPLSRVPKLPGGLPNTEAGAATHAINIVRMPTTYPLSTVLIIALIAFLIGSLLRSLLSPADFIYVVTDLQDAEGSAGWREIKRLLEVKYIVGGWDFQIAVVRRH